MVQKKKDGPWQFVDKDGNAIKLNSDKKDNILEEMFDFSEGYALVQKEKDGPWQFVNKNGNIIANNYALVQKEKDGPWQFVDTLGRVVDAKDKSSEDFNKFCQDFLKLEELSDEYFADDVFYNGVVREVKNKFLEYVNQIYSKGEEVNVEMLSQEVMNCKKALDAKYKAAHPNAKDAARPNEKSAEQNGSPESIINSILGE